MCNMGFYIFSHRAYLAGFYVGEIWGESVMHYPALRAASGTADRERERERNNKHDQRGLDYGNVGFCGKMLHLCLCVL